MEHLYITSSIALEEVNNLLQKLQQNLKNGGIDVEVGNSILYDAGSLEKFVSMDGVIFVEQMEKSLLEEIESEVWNCGKYNVKNLGFIVIE